MEGVCRSPGGVSDFCAGIQEYESGMEDMAFRLNYMGYSAVVGFWILTLKY